MIATAMAVNEIWEPLMPFRGMLSKEMNDLAHKVDFHQVVLSWLPTWWLCLAISFTSAGISIGCSIWAAVAQVTDQPYGTPVLIGAAAFVTALTGMVVPIAQAYFKDRSEVRQAEILKQKVRELELMARQAAHGHQKNAEQLKRVGEVTQRLVDITPGIEVQVIQPQDSHSK